MQTPAAIGTTAFEETEHTLGVELFRFTDRPTLEVAEIAWSSLIVVIEFGSANVIVCGNPVTLKFWVTLGAGRKLALPPCEATTVQVPLPTALTVPDEMVQTLGVLLEIETIKPELAVAVRA